MKTTTNQKSRNTLSVTRKKLGLTQVQLAAKLEVSRSSIEHAETGRRSLNTAALIKLAMLEIERHNKPVETTPGPATGSPLTYLVARANRSHAMMQMQEAACRLKSRKLSISLDTMLRQHERTSLLVQMIEKSPSITGTVTRQKEAAIKKLDKCGLAAQGLLKHEISLVNAQAELYADMQGHIKNQLNELR